MRAPALFLIASAALVLHTRCASRARAEVPLLERSFVEGAVRMDGESLSIGLLANTPLGQPRIRTEPGRIRLWFPDLPYTRTFEIDGNGSAVRRTFVRAGASGTGLVSIELRDATQLISQEQVSVALSASSASVTLPLVLARSEEQTPAPAPPERPMQNLTSPHLGANASSSAKSSAPSAPLRAPSSRGVTQRLRQPPTSRAMTTPWTLVAVGILVALTFGAAHVLKRGRGPGGSRIEVISQCRIGPKQQLVIVRAMGKDHLLSIDAQRTERLASTESHSQAKQSEAASGLMKRREKNNSLPHGSNDESPVELPLRTLGLGNASFGRVLSSFRSRPATAVAPISLFDDEQQPSEQGVRDSTPIDGISSLPGARSPAIAGILRLRATS